MIINFPLDFNANKIENFVLKVTKQGDACEEVVVERKSLWTYFGKYIYSGRYTYNLDRIKNVLDNGFAEKPYDLKLEMCRLCFNKEVTEYNNSWWAKVSGTALKTIEVAKKIFESSQPVIPRILKQAQQATIEGDIPKAAFLIESYGKQTKKKSLEEVDICQGFDIQDNTIGQHWKGLLQMGSFNTILGGEEGETPLLEEIMAKEYLSNSPQGILVFQKDKEIFHIFRRNKEDSIEIFDRKTGVWTACDENEYKKLGLGSKDLLIFLGEPMDLQQGKGLHYAAESRGPTVGNFYHESQGPQSGSYCAVHAANAFFGYHAIDMGSFYPAARSLIIAKYGLLPDTLYAIRKNKDGNTATDDVADVRKGTDASILLDYIKSLVDANHLPKEYSSLGIYQFKLQKRAGEGEKIDVVPEPGEGQKKEQLNLKSVSKNCDRVIIGYGGSHFAAIRKNKDGTWQLIDSMEHDSQKEHYKTLEDAITQPPRAATVQSITLIY